MPAPHPAQRAILRSRSRFCVVACGRRFGKTEVGKHALLRAVRAGKTCWWLAPTYGMAGQVWRDLKAICRDLPDLTISQTDRRIDFGITGGSLAIHSAHYPDNLRGAGLDFVVLDEAAFMDPAVWPEVVQPMLLERQGGALFLSSPNGRNWFWELFQSASSRRGWRAFHYPSSANPLIPPAELAAIRRRTPERIWRVEYLAEFADDLGQVFRRIRESATAPLGAVPQPGHRYVAGVDWGREGDYTAIVVLDATAGAVVALDRFNQVAWSLQRGRLAALCERWRPAVIFAESNSIGSPNIEALQSEGLPVRPFLTMPSTKSPLIESLALAIERADLALLPDETLLAELSSYTVQRLPSGAYRYSAPPGLHDDCVIALALAWHAAHHAVPSIDFA